MLFQQQTCCFVDFAILIFILANCSGSITGTERNKKLEWLHSPFNGTWKGCHPRDFALWVTSVYFPNCLPPWATWASPGLRECLCFYRNSCIETSIYIYKRSARFLKKRHATFLLTHPYCLPLFWSVSAFQTVFVI